MSPVRHQAITGTNADFFQLDSGHEHVSFKNINLNIPSTKWRTFCLGSTLWPEQNCQHFDFIFKSFFERNYYVGTLPISTNLPRWSGFTRYDGWFVTDVLTPNKRQALSNRWVDPTSVIMNDMMQHTHNRIIEREKARTCCMLMTC